ncbi:MAG: DUF6470 family protein, partial [Oscillospiraceae bacterium]
MGPLLKMRTIPFSFEYKITDAKLEIDSSNPQVKITREKGGLQIENIPAKIHIDSTAARESMGLKSIKTASKEAAERGKQIALESIGQFAREGNMMMDTRNKNAFGEIVLNRTRDSVETMMGFIPSTPSQVTFDKHQLNMRYQADKLQFDWQTA